MTTETKSLIIVTILSILLLAGGAWLYQKNAPSAVSNTLTENQDALVRENSIKVTPTNATSSKVTVVEFGDYQCPACAQIAPGVKQLKETYKDSITFVFRDYPLNIHRNAIPSAQMTYIANEQGKYWEMHEKLYSTQAEWGNLEDPSDKFVEYAKSLGMNTAGIKEKLSTGAYLDRIKADIKDAELLGVNSTPTFFVGNTIIRTANFNAIKTAIDAELAK